MTILNNSLWRRGAILSATFLIGLLVSVSCKKKNTDIGKDIIDQNDLLTSGGVDTFSLVTFTLFEDSVPSSNKVFSTLGSYTDPQFNTFNAEIYTQFSLSELSPAFGTTSDIVIDSFVLGLEYVGKYGSKGDQIVEAFEIIDANGVSYDSTYYSFSTLATSGTDLVDPNKNMIFFDEENLTVIGSDTVEPQLRIYLDTNLARTFFDEWESNPSTFDDNDNFQDYFKGLNLKTNNGIQASGDGGIFYFQLSSPFSKATIYFTQGGINYTYDLLITSVDGHFNHIDIDNSGTNVQNVIDNTSLGQVEYYTQSYGSEAVVQLPFLSKIPKNAVIHEAKLHLPVQYQTGSAFTPGSQLSISRRDVGTTDEPIQTALSGFYDDYTKEFTISLRSLVQAVVTEEINDQELILRPLLFELSADRIIFNGPDSDNKAKPRLNIIYTEF